MMFSLEIVSCLGACGLAPVMTINDKVYSAMTPEKAEAVIDEIIAEEEIEMALNVSQEGGF